MATNTMDVYIPENQRHLLDHWDHLSETQRDRLAAQLRQVDFDLMDQLYSGEIAELDWRAMAAQAEPPQAFRLDDSDNRFSRDQAIDLGRRALSSGRLGVVLVAGGQGSRLGFSHPKGMYPIGPLSKKTLFQFHLEQVKALSQRYGVRIPLYLMTSPATHEETVAFLKEQRYFGLPESDVCVFCQGTMPAVDATTGRLILAAPDQLFLSPDGHGGTLAALEANGCLTDAEARGIEQLFYFQVDNPLVEIGQAELVGYHLLSHSELTTQVVAKQDPFEKVGNVVRVDGQSIVIEYSDLPDELADRRDGQGRPIFWAGNIAVHVFTLDFLRRACSDRDSMPFHRALKQVPYVNPEGSVVTPEKPNAIKFEKFIFDLMPFANNPIVVEADAREVFAPLKNASGSPKDTPEATREAILAKHRKMLEAVNVRVESGAKVEISALFALDSDELRQKIPDSTVISEDRYFEP